VNETLEDKELKKKQQVERKMSDMSSGLLKIPQFTGKKEEFPLWQSQIEAMMSIKGVSYCLSENFKDALPSTEAAVLALDESKPDEKKQIQAVKDNKLAFSYLTMALNSPSMLKMVHASKTNEWPGGRVDFLMSKLLKKFMPKDEMAVAELMLGLFQLKLKPDQDPEELGDEMASLENMYACPLEDKEKVAAIMAAAGSKYADVILQETKKLQARGETVTAEALIDAMSEKYRITHGVVSSGEAVEHFEKETALAEIMTFTGLCYLCGQRGHRAKDCPNKKGDILCELCGGKGHNKARCWEDEKNAKRRPKGWSSRLKGSAGEESGGVLLCGETEILLSDVDEEQFEFEVHKVVQENSVHKVVQVEDDVHKDVLDVEDVHKVVQQDKHKVAVEDEHKVAPVEFDMHKVAENGEHKVALAVYHKVDTDDDHHKVDVNAVDHKVGLRTLEMSMSSGDVYANDLQDSDASSMSSMFSKYDMYQNNEEVSLSDNKVDGGIVPSYDMNSDIMLAVENFEQGGVLECDFYARQFTSESGANTI